MIHCHCTLVKVTVTTGYKAEVTNFFFFHVCREKEKTRDSMRREKKAARLRSSKWHWHLSGKSVPGARTVASEQPN